MATWDKVVSRLTPMSGRLLITLSEFRYEYYQLLESRTLLPVDLLPEISLYT
jgi:hypothetical protein